MTALGRYQATYRAVPIGLLSFDRENRIERYNEVAVRLFDVPAGSIDPHHAPGARADASPLAIRGDSASLDRAHVDTLSALNDAFVCWRRNFRRLPVRRPVDGTPARCLTGFQAAAGKRIRIRQPESRVRQS